MKTSKLLVWLVALIALLAFVATGLGVLWQGSGQHLDFITLRGQTVALQGDGLYKFDSVTNASQLIAQDVVTLVMGLPLLVIGLILYRKNQLRGKFLLCGTLAYFLYTYTSYVMLVTYNTLFLVYVALFSLSLFAFILSLREMEVAALPGHFSGNLPRKSIAAFLFLLSSFLLLAWLGRIVPSLLDDTPPVGLESSTTLVIQALDLGVIAPLGYLAGFLLLKRQAWGYLLSSVVLFMGFTMGTTICAMIASQVMAGIEIAPVEAILFAALALTGIALTFDLFRNISERAIIKKSI
jgi:hypothetical protein